MSSLLYPAYAIACLFVLGFGWRLFRGRPRAGTAIVLLVTFGVLYDNLVLAIGALAGDAIEPGDALLALSVPRFVLHQLVLPWLIYAAWEMARQAGHGWAARRSARPLAIVLSAVVMVAGIATRLAGLQLEPEVVDGVLRYVAVGTAGPPVVSIVSIGFVGLTGLVFWRRNRWPWVFLAAVAVFVAEAFPDEAVRRDRVGLRDPVPRRAPRHAAPPRQGAPARRTRPRSWCGRLTTGSAPPAEARPGGTRNGRCRRLDSAQRAGSAMRASPDGPARNTVPSAATDHGLP